MNRGAAVTFAAKKAKFVLIQIMSVVTLGIKSYLFDFIIHNVLVLASCNNSNNYY